MDFRDSKILELQDSAIPRVDGTVTAPGAEISKSPHFFMHMQTPRVKIIGSRKSILYQKSQNCTAGEERKMLSLLSDLNSGENSKTAGLAAAYLFSHT